MPERTGKELLTDDVKLRSEESRELTRIGGGDLWSVISGAVTSVMGPTSMSADTEGGPLCTIQSKVKLN